MISKRILRKINLITFIPEPSGLIIIDSISIYNAQCTCVCVCLSASC